MPELAGFDSPNVGGNQSDETRLLLEAGADVRVTGGRGATPMSVAVTTSGS